jgi:hypothetical protein
MNKTNIILDVIEHGREEHYYKIPLLLEQNTLDL